MSDGLKPYTFDDLSLAVRDLNAAREGLKQLKKELDPKRSQLAELEKRECDLLQEIEKHKTRIRKISQNLE